MEEIWRERWQLASERIREIAEDPEVEGNLGTYFRKTAKFLLLMLEVREKVADGAQEHASLEELKAWNQRLYEDISGEAYGKSFANPAYAVRELSEDYGQLLAFVYTELRGMIVYAYEQRVEEMLICMELFLQIHSEFADEMLPTREQIASDIYSYLIKKNNVMVTRRVR